MKLHKRIIAGPLTNDNGEDIDIAAPESEEPVNIVERNDVLDRIENLVVIFFRDVLPNDHNSKAGLREKEQKFVRLKYIANLSSLEIGDIFEMKTGAVDTVLYRAKGKIRDYFKKEGLWEEVMEALRDAEE